MHKEQLHVLRGPIDVLPRWRILPVRPTEPITSATPPLPRARDAGNLAQIPIYIHHRGAFGTGAHPTTRLCLQALAAFTRPFVLAQRSFRVLDFGSGTGILSLGAALLGGCAHAVEIDPVAIENAQENAILNGVADRLVHSRSLSIPECPPHHFDIVIANILRPVLLEYADALKAHVGPQGWLVLSGLVATDVPSITARFALPNPQIYRADEWCLVAWQVGA